MGFWKNLFGFGKEKPTQEDKELKDLKESAARMTLLKDENDKTVESLESLNTLVDTLIKELDDISELRSFYE